VYVRGPTGPFQALSPVVAGTVYDPTRLLDPSGGLAGVLTSARGARTASREDVDGQDAFRVGATLDGKALGPLVPNPVPPEVPATLWIGAAHPFLLKAETSLPRGSSEATAITLTVSDFNVTVEVTPPPTS
jgi:lipoprotein LprG